MQSATLNPNLENIQGLSRTAKEVGLQDSYVKHSLLYKTLRILEGRLPSGNEIDLPRSNFRDTIAATQKAQQTKSASKPPTFGSKTIDTERVFNLHAVSLLSKTGSIYVLILITVITLPPFLQRFLLSR